MAVSAATFVSLQSSTDGSSFATSSVTPAAGKLYLASVSNTKGTTPDTPTFSGGGLTWVQVATVTYNTAGTPTTRMTVFRALGSSPSSGALTADFAGATQTGCNIFVSEWTGIDGSGTDGSAAVVQSASNTVDSGTSITVTLSAFGHASNATYGAQSTNLTVNSTIGSGFSLLARGGYNTPNNISNTEWKASNDTTVDWTFASANAGAIALEIKAAPVFAGSVSATVTPSGAAKADGKAAGSGVLNLAPAGLGKGTGAPAGSAAATLTPSAPGFGSAAAVGSAQASLSPAGLGKGTGAPAGSASAALTPSAPGRGTAAAAGTATAALTPSGAARAGGAALGAVQASLAPSGAVRGTGAPQGSAALIVTPTATGRGSGALLGPSTMTVSCAGVALGTVRAAGITTIILTPTGQMGQPPFVGSVTVSVSPSGAALGTGAALGSAVLTLSPAGEIDGSGRAAGETLFVLSAAGVARGSDRLLGGVEITLTGSLSSAVGNLSGTCTLTLTPSGKASDLILPAFVDVGYMPGANNPHYNHKYNVFFPPPGARKFAAGAPWLFWINNSGFASTFRHTELRPKDGVLYLMCRAGWVIFSVSVTISGQTQDDPVLVPGSPKIAGWGLFHLPIDPTTGAYSDEWKLGGLHCAERDGGIGFQHAIRAASKYGIDPILSGMGGRSGGGFISAHVGMSIDRNNFDGFWVNATTRPRWLFLRSAGFWWSIWEQGIYVTPVDPTFTAMAANHFYAGGYTEPPTQATLLSQVQTGVKAHASAARAGFDATKYPALISGGQNINALGHRGYYLYSPSPLISHDFDDGNDLGVYDGLYDNGKEQNAHTVWSCAAAKEQLKEIGVVFGAQGKVSRFITTAANAGIGEDATTSVGADEEAGALDPVEPDMLLWGMAQLADGFYETATMSLQKVVASLATSLALSVEYDNQPFEHPEDATWARFRVYFEVAEAGLVGATNTYRKTGTAELSIFVPVQTGDHAALAVADAVRAAVRDVTTAEGLVMRYPTVTNRGRADFTAGPAVSATGWWQVDVAWEFHGYDSAQKRESLGTFSGAMGFDQAASIVRMRWRDWVETVYQLGTHYDDAPYEHPEDEAWARFTVLPGEARQVERGAVKSRWRVIGAAVAQVFVPVNAGNQQALRLADQIDDAMRAVVQDGVHFDVPTVRPVGRSEGWWQINVTCPFFADEVA